jgi:hypothetical protein
MREDADQDIRTYREEVPHGWQVPAGEICCRPRRGAFVRGDRTPRRGSRGCRRACPCAPDADHRACPACRRRPPRAPADAGGWPLLPRLRLITTRAATMISAAHSATSVSSSSSMVSPPGERSHVVPYPAGPSRYHLGRDPARAARWQPHATHPARSAGQGLRLPLRERLSVRHHQVPKWVGCARWSGLTALIPGLAGASPSASAGFRYGSRSWGWQCDRVCRKGVREAGEPGRSASRRAGCRS